jgi:hypothetical protein
VGETNVVRFTRDGRMTIIWCVAFFLGEHHLVEATASGGSRA